MYNNVNVYRQWAIERRLEFANDPRRSMLYGRKHDTATIRCQQPNSNDPSSFKRQWPYPDYPRSTTPEKVEIEKTVIRMERELFRLAVTSAGSVDAGLSLGSFLQPAGCLFCEICDDDVGARAFDARQNF